MSANSFSKGELLAKRLLLGGGGGRAREPGRGRWGLWINSGLRGSRKPAALIRASRSWSLCLLNISASSS